VQSVPMNSTWQAAPKAQAMWSQWWSSRRPKQEDDRHVSRDTTSWWPDGGCCIHLKHTIGTELVRIKNSHVAMRLPTGKTSYFMLGSIWKCSQCTVDMEMRYQLLQEQGQDLQRLLGTPQMVSGTRILVMTRWVDLGECRLQMSPEYKAVFFDGCIFTRDFVDTKLLFEGK